MRSFIACIVAGFILQAAVLLAVSQTGFPDRSADVLGYLLMPGVVLFGDDGIHSTAPFVGLALALLLDTVYYALIVFGLVRTMRRYHVLAVIQGRTTAKH
jgi:hypothetical protein